MVMAGRSPGPFRHGCVIVVGNRIVGRGWNRVRPPHAVVGQVPWHVKWQHAEEAAISDAGNSVEGAVLYVARLSRADEAVLSRPCVSCWKLIDRFSIRRAVWTP